MIVCFSSRWWDVNVVSFALNGAIASGAEAAIIPEISMEKDQLAEMIETGFPQIQEQ